MTDGNIQTGLYLSESGYRTPRPIAGELRRQASQENCDGDPYDAMVFAAAHIDHLNSRIVALTEQSETAVKNQARMAALEEGLRWYEAQARLCGQIEQGEKALTELKGDGGELARDCLAHGGIGPQFNTDETPEAPGGISG